MTLVQELEKLVARYGEDIPREDIMRLIGEHCGDETCTQAERVLVEAEMANMKNYTDGAFTRLENAAHAVLSERKEAGK